MKPKTLYLLLCGLGTALPLWQFIPFLREHGLTCGCSSSSFSPTR
jgi:hypothetical protein